MGGEVRCVAKNVQRTGGWWVGGSGCIAFRGCHSATKEINRKIQKGLLKYSPELAKSHLVETTTKTAVSTLKACSERITWKTWWTPLVFEPPAQNGVRTSQRTIARTGAHEG